MGIPLENSCCRYFGLMLNPPYPSKVAFLISKNLDMDKAGGDAFLPRYNIPSIERSLTT
jgi:hypothetical protein